MTQTQALPNVIERYQAVLNAYSAAPVISVDDTLREKIETLSSGSLDLFLDITKIQLDLCGGIVGQLMGLAKSLKSGTEKEETLIEYEDYYEGIIRELLKTNMDEENIPLIYTDEILREIASRAIVDYNKGEKGFDEEEFLQLFGDTEEYDPKAVEAMQALIREAEGEEARKAIVGLMVDEIIGRAQGILTSDSVLRTGKEYEGDRLLYEIRHRYSDDGEPRTQDVKITVYGFKFPSFDGIDIVSYLEEYYRLTNPLHNDGIHFPERLMVTNDWRMQIDLNGNDSPEQVEQKLLRVRQILEENFEFTKWTPLEE